MGIGEDEAPMLARLKAAREGISDQTIASVPELANSARRSGPEQRLLRALLPRVASPPAVAGHSGRPHAAEAKVHHRTSLERQHLSDDGDGKVRRAAVGLHSRRRARKALQARPRGVPVRG